MRGTSVLKTGCLAAAFALFALPAGVARAGGLAEPRVEYSADQSLGSGGQVMESRVYHAPGKQRMDMGRTESAQYVITRMDRKVSWVVMPEQKMYMEMSLEDARKKSRDITNCSFSRKIVGTETVNGIAAAKSEFEASCPDRSAYGGFVWISKDGILVKMDAVAKGKGRESRILMELKNLAIGRQDPAMFEIPPGYRMMKVPAGILPGGGGGIDRQERLEDSGRSSEEEPTAPEAAEEKGTVEKAVEPMKKLKGLFRW